MAIEKSTSTNILEPSVLSLADWPTEWATDWDRVIMMSN